MDRVHRILKLIVLLQGRQGIAGRELMEQLGVSRRTLFRDLNVLELAGIAYHHEKGQGYRLAHQSFLKPLNLTVPETLGLMLLAKTTPARRTAPLGRDAVSAIAKMTAMVPGDVRQACHDLLAHVSVDHGAQLHAGNEAANYIHLQRCLDESRRCRLTYQGPCDPEPVVVGLDPYAMHFASRAWYVMGHCDRFDEVRMFKLGRIKAIEPMEAFFVRPAGFNPMDKIGQAWQLIPEGKVHAIELEFSRRVAGNVVETRWHASQKHRTLPDGRCRVTFEVDGLNEISWWICGYADQVQVIKPPELRSKVADMLRQALRAYEGDAPGQAHIPQEP